MKKEWQIRFECLKYNIVFSNFSNGGEYSEAQGVVESNNDMRKYPFFVREKNCNQGELENMVFCLPSSGSGLMIEALAEKIISEVKSYAGREPVLTIKMLRLH